MTLRLWRRLLNPDIRNPLFRRVVEDAQADLTLALRWHIAPRIYRLLLVALILAAVAVNPLLPAVALFVLPIALILGFTLLPFSLPLVVNGIGFFWAANIGAAVARQKLLRRYDLLSVSLDGSLNASWIIASACVWRGGFGILHVAQRGVLWLGIGLLALGSVSGAAALRSGDGQQTLLMLRTLADMAALLAGFQLHYLQTVILSLAAGMYAAAYLANPFEARLAAALVLLAAQAGAYIVFGLAVVGLLAPLETPFYEAHPAAYMSLPFLYLLCFCLPREVIIMALWYALSKRLNASAVERDGLISLSGS